MLLACKDGQCCCPPILLAGLLSHQSSPSVCTRMPCIAVFPGLSLYNVELQCAAGAGGGAPKRKKGERAQRSALLFTHRGYSGPAVLDLSHRLTMAQERGTPPPGALPICS